ncbi:DUF3859 domain-containing protein [Desulfolutivibrio sulfoxidireducens]|uniref:DUF3859 domain-containing protein n=1 Tax=Desulfolutivibrio sulfoxidireducens TaxID=2773299 RepID=UPI00159D6952|nr:DUF3859 domain-containing protein [Desulfolutivibrio sulfoxidireducens]
MKHAVLAAVAVLLSLCWIEEPSGARAASETGDRPEVSGLTLVQSGLFAPVAPDAVAARSSRYRLIRTGETVPAVPGVAFGVVFEVRGKPAGQVVMIEAGLIPAKAPTTAGTPNDPPAVRRWFVPAVVGETAQAVTSFAYAWEAAPGRWRLTLAEGGRVLAEKDFFVGGSETAASQAGTPSPESSAPVASPGDQTPPPAASASLSPAATPDPGPGHGTPPPHKPEEPAIPDQATSTPQVPPRPSVPSSPVAPGAPPGPDNGKAVAKDARETGEKPEVKAPAVSDTAPVGKKTAEPPAPKAPGKTPPKSSAKSGEEAAPPAKGMAFLVQTGLFSVKDNALAEAARYRAKGYPGCVLEEGGGEKKRFRVIVGRFADRERAVAARRSFVAGEGGEAVIKEVPAAEASRKLICR